MLKKPFVSIFLLFTFAFLQSKNLSGQSTPEIRAFIDSSEVYYITDGDKTIHFALKALKLAEELDDYWGLVNAQQMVGEGLVTLGKLDSAIYHFDLAMKLAIKEGDETERGNCLISKASIATNAGRHQEAIVYYNKGIKVKEALQDSASLCSVLLRLGGVYSQLGDHAMAADKYLTSIRICEAINNMQMVGYNFGSLGMIHDKQGNYKEAEEYFNKGVDVFTEMGDNFGIAGLRNNMGIMYKNMEQFDKSIENYEFSLEKFEAIGYKPGINACQTNLAILQVKKGLYESAEPFAQYGLQTAIELGNRESEQDNLNTLAQIEQGLKNYRKAIEYGQSSLEIAEELGSKEKLRDVNQTLSNIYKDMGQFDQSLNYYKKMVEHKDSILNATQSKQISELRTIYETEKKDQEITMLAKQTELDDVKKTRLWIGLVFTLLLGSLLVLLLRQKRKKDRQIFTQQQTIEKEKTRIAQLESSRLERELEFKQKELTAKVLQLARKNDFLQNLDQEVLKIREQSEPNLKDATRKLSRMINQDVEAETDWDDFLNSFKQVHTSFIERLTEEFEELTINDMKLACLFKMQLSSKEIASALNVSPAGIKKARHRLRKRLKLQPDEDIYTFFINYPRSNS